MNIYFIKTKKTISTPLYFDGKNKLDEELVKKFESEFVPDASWASFPIKKLDGYPYPFIFYPLSEESYKGVLSSMSVQEAGEWALSKCSQQNWDKDLFNIQCCLSNLEMDY